jgi:hypothetical protein
MNKTTNKYSPEVRERAVRMVLDGAMPTESDFAKLSAYPAQLNSDVTAIGFPLQGILSGLNVTRGSVSGEYGIGGSPDELQVTAPVQPGNSGGPLVNQAGDIVGVVSSKLNATKVADAIGDIPQNVNFAIRGQTLQTWHCHVWTAPVLQELI